MWHFEDGHCGHCVRDTTDAARPNAEEHVAQAIVEDLLEQTGDQAAEHLRRFNGKEQDQLTGLSYYGYRYYDPLSLSWTQSDPLYRFAPDLNAALPYGGPRN